MLRVRRRTSLLAFMYWFLRCRRASSFSFAVLAAAPAAFGPMMQAITLSRCAQ